MSKLKEVPDFYTFQRGLVYSHRDFQPFFSALNRGEKYAILSGFNASGTIHLGHKPVFDTNLFFQKKYGIPVFIPISDDESTGVEEAISMFIHVLISFRQRNNFFKLNYSRIYLSPSTILIRPINAYQIKWGYLINQYRRLYPSNPLKL